MIPGDLNVYVGTKRELDPPERRELYPRGHLCFVVMQNAFAPGCSRNREHSVSPLFLPSMKLTAELGECELPEHTPELVSEFRFIPNQTEAMEFDIFQRWKECRYLVATI